MVCAEKSISSNTRPSGQKATVVPVRPLGAGPVTSSLVLAFPPSWNSIRWCLPSRSTSTTNRFDRALTTDTPTPCSPPDTL